MASNRKTKTVPIDHYLRLLEDEIGRARLASMAGVSFGGRRDLYTSLGYNRSPVFDDFLDRYRRNEIARAVVVAPTTDSWKGKPRVLVPGKPGEKFELAWKGIVSSTRLWSKLSRLDRMAGIGEYAVLVLGFDDSADMSAEVEKGSAKTLLYVTPYTQGSAVVSKYDNDVKSSRFGQPLSYTIRPKNKTSQLVHWSRAIHVAEDPLEDEVSGEPRMKVVLNRIENLELVCGGSSEMYWRGALPGTIFKLPADTNMKPDDPATKTKLDAIKVKIEAFIHDMQRDLLVAGIDAQQLQVQIADPASNIESLLSLVAAGTRIPKRILMGSERGELASSQDERNWLSTIETRRIDYCEELILRPLVDRLVFAGALPEPEAPYVVEWPDLVTRSDKEIAEAAVAISTALRNYVEALGADLLIPPPVFFEEVLRLSPAVMSKIEDAKEEMWGREPDKGTSDDTGREPGLDKGTPGAGPTAGPESE